MTKVWHDQLSPDALRRAFDISAWLLDGEGVIAIPHRNGILSCEGPLLEWTFALQGRQPSEFGGRLKFFL
jgi:hypothetical protein